MHYKTWQKKYLTIFDTLSNSLEISYTNADETWFADKFLKKIDWKRVIGLLEEQNTKQKVKKGFFKFIK